MAAMSHQVCTLDQVQIHHKCTIRGIKFLISNNGSSHGLNDGSFVASTFSDLESEFKFSLIVYPSMKHNNTQQGSSYRNTQQGSYDGFIKVTLRSLNSSKISVKFSIGFLKSNKEWYTHSSPGYQTFIKNTELGMPDGGCSLTTLNQNIDNDNLVIICRLTVLTPRIRGQLTATEETENAPTSIYSDLNQMFEDMKYTDLTLIVQGKKIHAHKVFLAARSEVFAAMLDSEMVESKTSEVIIEDVSHEVFLEILRFIYTDKVENLNELAVDLLAGADKYELDGLMKICQNFLISTLTVDNVCEIFNMADLHGAFKLKDEAISYINLHTAQVFKTDGWKKLTADNPKLVTDLYCKLAEN